MTNKLKLTKIKSDFTEADYRSITTMQGLRHEYSSIDAQIQDIISSCQQKQNIIVDSLVAKLNKILDTDESNIFLQRNKHFGLGSDFGKEDHEYTICINIDACNHHGQRAGIFVYLIYNIKKRNLQVEYKNVNLSRSNEDNITVLYLLAKLQEELSFLYMYLLVKNKEQLPEYTGRNKSEDYKDLLEEIKSNMQNLVSMYDNIDTLKIQQESLSIQAKKVYDNLVKRLKINFVRQLKKGSLIAIRNRHQHNSFYWYWYVIVEYKKKNKQATLAEIHDNAAIDGNSAQLYVEGRSFVRKRSVESLFSEYIGDAEFSNEYLK